MVNFATDPAIYCPFPSAISPFADRIQQHTLGWVKQFNLVTEDKAWQLLVKSKFGRLAARAYPKAPLDRLEIVSDWNTWLFILDDQCDEWGLGKDPEKLGSLHHRCLEILFGSEPDDGDVTLVHAINDIWMRIQALMPLAWQARFINSAAEYFESIKWEAENRQTNTWPYADTYIRMRPFTGGLLTDIDLIELTDSIHLPLEVRKHHCIGELIKITNNVVCWSNDIISLKKEHDYEDKHNLALILNHQLSRGLQKSIDKVSELIAIEVRRFVSLEQSLPNFGFHIDSEVARFIEVMKAWMRGNLDWSYESGRYRPAPEENAVVQNERPAHQPRPSLAGTV